MKRFHKGEKTTAAAVLETLEENSNNSLGHFWVLSQLQVPLLEYVLVFTPNLAAKGQGQV